VRPAIRPRRSGKPDKIMDDIDWLQILKWVLVVLAAGFIGQFGKRLADYLLARRRKQRDTQAQAANAANERPTSPPHPSAPAAYDAKTAKKLAKAAAKATKKGAKKH